MNWRGLLISNIPWPILLLLNKFFFQLDGSEATALILWYYFLFLLGMLFFPVVASLFPKAIDRGYSLSKGISLLFLFWINWIGTSVGIFQFNESGLFLSLFILLLFTHLKSNADLFDLLEENFKKILTIEISFFILFIFFLIVNSFHPEIYFGEKAMDFNLLNFMTRTEVMPPEDPWFAGKLMNYYYFGYYIFSGLIKMSGAKLDLGYALSMATIPALFGASLFSLLLAVTKRVKYSLFGSTFIVLGSNWKSVSAILVDKVQPNISYFWSTTRVFPGNAFAEYPVWSFLFSDLHPHVMAYPFSLMFLTFFYFHYQNQLGKNLFVYFFFSLCWGGILGLNTWDTLFYSLFISLFFIIDISLSRNKFREKYISWSKLLGISILGPILFYPLFKTLGTGRPFFLSFWKGEGIPWSSYLDHQGHWFLIIALFFIPLFLTKIRKRKVKAAGHSFLFKYFLALIFVIFITNHIVIFDRINTIFKFHNQIYILLGLLAMSGLRYSPFFMKKFNRRFVFIFLTVFCSLSLLGTFFQIKAINSYRPFGGRGSTLHGAEYLKRMNSEDYSLVQWFRKNVQGTPVLVEKYSKSFDKKGARISTHTGLPTYLGWDNHVFIRGAKRSAIRSRQREIDFVFNSIDPVSVHSFLIKKNISFVIIGKLERRHYKKKGLVKFNQYERLFHSLFKNGDSQIFGVGNYQDYIFPQIKN
jgi:uncharacterized membrane protein